MLQDDILNGRSQVHLFLSGPSIPQIAIESRPAHLGQLAQSLDIRAALQRHLRSYFVVDTSPPEARLCRRRAPTLCKARLKKSSSIVLFANTRLRARICLRNMTSRERPIGGSVVCSNLSRQPYSRWRAIPSSRQSLEMLSHAFICSTACFRNSLLYRSPFFRSTLRLLSRKVFNTGVSQSRGSLHVTKMRRNGFRRAWKCFRIKVTSTVGV